MKNWGGKAEEKQPEREESPTKAEIGIKQTFERCQVHGSLNLEAEVFNLLMWLNGGFGE